MDDSLLAPIHENETNLPALRFCLSGCFPSNYSAISQSLRGPWLQPPENPALSWFPSSIRFPMLISSLSGPFSGLTDSISEFQFHLLVVNRWICGLSSKSLPFGKISLSLFSELLIGGPQKRQQIQFCLCLAGQYHSESEVFAHLILALRLSHLFNIVTLRANIANILSWRYGSHPIPPLTGRTSKSRSLCLEIASIPTVGDPKISEIMKKFSVCYAFGAESAFRTIRGSKGW
jgi:hypothetical protein